MDNQNKNMILATALSFLVILVWFVLFPPEEPPAPTPEPVAEATAPVDGGVAALPPGAATGAPPLASPAETRQAALSASERLTIETPELSGSISLTGGRIDNIALKSYRETIEPDSANVTLLSPIGSAHAYYALYGWAPGAGLDFDQVPGANTEWTAASGDTLGPDSPITLTWDNGAGLRFEKTISVDKQFMFTVTQRVTNTGDSTRRLAPYGIVARHGEPETVNFFILHEGVVRMSDGTLQEIEYGDMPDMEFVDREAARADIIDVAANGWIGFTD
ncbi:MAG: membrane protein insertase YidC, partial [Rhodobacteraceae bacterium]|nr:membrane protein insertase YidC [Paracoccaceae bacterium]